MIEVPRCADIESDAATDRRIVDLAPALRLSRASADERDQRRPARAPPPAGCWIAGKTGCAIRRCDDFVDARCDRDNASHERIRDRDVQPRTSAGRTAAQSIAVAVAAQPIAIAVAVALAPGGLVIVLSRAGICPDDQDGEYENAWCRRRAPCAGATRSPANVRAFYIEVFSFESRA